MNKRSFTQEEMMPAPSTTDLDRLIATLGDLPSSPAIVSAVIGMASDLNTQLSEFGKVLSADQALTAKVLRLSNSSFYGRAKQIATVDEAIVTLGYYTLRSLVVASSTHMLFKQKEAARLLPALWEHSLGAAVTARLLGRSIRHPQTEEAFIGGLLHDVGKLVMLQKFRADYLLVRKDVERDGDWIRAEHARFGFSHVNVGVALLEKWNFPRSLIEAVALHHEEPQTAPERAPTLAQIIWLANRVAKHLGGAKAQAAEDWESRFRRANVSWTEDRIAQFLADCDEQLTQERWLFTARP